MVDGKVLDPWYWFILDESNVLYLRKGDNLNNTGRVINFWKLMSVYPSSYVFYEDENNVFYEGDGSDNMEIGLLQEVGKAQLYYAGSPWQDEQIYYKDSNGNYKLVEKGYSSVTYDENLEVGYIPGQNSLTWRKLGILNLNDDNEISNEYNTNEEQFDSEACFNYVIDNSIVNSIPDIRLNETIDNETNSEFKYEGDKQYILYVPYVEPDICI